MAQPVASSKVPAVLVSLNFGEPDFASDLQELLDLAQSAGTQSAEVITGRRARPDARFFAGKGKVAEIALAAAHRPHSIVIFNHELTPTQQRNLEEELGVPVVDRTSLILDIFAQRARTHEGKLQVELAQLAHLSTRLVRGWSHLERQKGGIGLRGPGETQLETDRRLIGKRIKLLKQKLERFERQRDIQRKARTRAGVMAVALVGYTNAGKSTLFNALANSQSYAADQLFATLDTTTRQLYLGPAARSASLSDTVGFIRDLPHGLVDAFQATLQEAVDADLLLHVVDASNPDFALQIEQVQRVLKDIGAHEIPQLLVFNKVDALDAEHQPISMEDSFEIEGVQTPRIFVSAKDMVGIAALRKRLGEMAALEGHPVAGITQFPESTGASF